MDAVLTCLVDEKIGPGSLGSTLIQLVREVFSPIDAYVLRSPAIALSFALRALKLPPASPVLLSALAPFWHYREVLHQGLQPLVLDVDIHSGLLSRDVVETGIASGARALLVPETLGNVPPAAVFLELGIPVIEDSSQSVGAVLGEKKVGTFGSCVIVGLEAHDMLTAGGGAVLMAFEAACARRLQALVPEALAVDMLPDMNAALACVQVKQQEKNIALRRAIYDRYSSALLRTRHGTLHRCEQLEHSAYAFPVVLASDLKEVTRYVRQASIEISPAFEHSIVAAFQLPAMRRRWPFPQFLPTSASHTAPFQGEDREVLETTQGAEKTCQDSSWEREVRASEITPEMCWPHASALLLRCVRFPLYPRLAPAHAQEIARILGTLP